MREQRALESSTSEQGVLANTAAIAQGRKQLSRGVGRHRAQGAVGSQQEKGIRRFVVLNLPWQAPAGPSIEFSSASPSSLLCGCTERGGEPIFHTAFSWWRRGSWCRERTGWEDAPVSDV